MASWAAASIIILLVISGCGSDGDGNTAPTLSFVGLNKPALFQGEGIGSDSIVVRLMFEDIDGDIEGLGNGLIPNNIVYVDTRDGTETAASFPSFPSEVTGGQRGQLDLTIGATCCLFEVFFPCTQGLDTANVFPYDIFIIDGQGNRSNTITTDPVTLLCP